MIQDETIQLAIATPMPYETAHKCIVIKHALGMTDDDFRSVIAMACQHDDPGAYAISMLLYIGGAVDDRMAADDR